MKRKLLILLLTLLFVLALLLIGFEFKETTAIKWTSFKIETWKLLLVKLIYLAGIFIIIKRTKSNNKI